jgi:hypothetical protein
LVQGRLNLPTRPTSIPTFNDVPLTDATAETIRLAIPAVAVGKTVHVVLEVIDAGRPALTRYRRVVLRVIR